MKLINANKFHRKSGMKLIERRLTPADSPLAITTAMVLAVLAAMLVTSLLFLSMERTRSRRTSPSFTNPSQPCAASAIPWCVPRR